MARPVQDANYIDVVVIIDHLARDLASSLVQSNITAPSFVYLIDQRSYIISFLWFLFIVLLEFNVLQLRLFQRCFKFLVNLESVLVRRFIYLLILIVLIELESFPAETQAANLFLRDRSQIAIEKVFWDLLCATRWLQEVSRSEKWHPFVKTPRKLRDGIKWRLLKARCRHCLDQLLWRQVCFVLVFVISTASHLIQQQIRAWFWPADVFHLATTIITILILLFQLLNTSYALLV